MLPKLVLLLALCPLGVMAQILEIVSPESRSYLRGVEDVQIQIKHPPLARSQNLVVSFDGKILGASGNEFVVPTADFNPNRYEIDAKILDEAGRVIAQDTRTVYIRANNARARKKQAQEDALAVYQALPWYKKLGYETPKVDPQIATPGINLP